MEIPWNGGVAGGRWDQPCILYCILSYIVTFFHFPQTTKVVMSVHFLSTLNPVWYSPWRMWTFTVGEPVEGDIVSDVMPSNIMSRQVCTLPPALVFVVLIVLSGAR